MKSKKSRDVCRAQKLLHRALVHAKSGRLEKAINLSMKALKLDSTLARAWNCIGFCRSKQGDDTKAIECYMRALEVGPPLLRPWVNLGNSYRNRGACRAALFCYAEATTLTPTEPEEWGMKAAAFSALKQETEARRCLEEQDRINLSSPTENKRSGESSPYCRDGAVA